MCASITDVAGDAAAGAGQRADLQRARLPVRVRRGRRARPDHRRRSTTSPPTASAGDPGFYLQVGVLGSAVYAVANTARGDYRLGNFLGGKVHSRRILVHWHGTFLCLLAIGFLAQMSVDLFARLDRAVLRLRAAAAGAAPPPADRARRSMRAAAASSPPRRSSWSAPSRASPPSCSATGRRSSASRSRAAASCRCCPGRLSPAGVGSARGASSNAR